MFVGSKNFAIESDTSALFTNRSQMALGYFNIVLAERRFGVFAKDASLLSCSYDSVIERISMAGGHTISLPLDFNALHFVMTYRKLHYGVGKETFFQVDQEERLLSEIHTNDLTWAPDGDEAFDDGSHVFQIDIGDKVRLIGFNNNDEETLSSREITDILIDYETYYEVLKNWSHEFYENWEKHLPMK